MKFGVQLPHFGPLASLDGSLALARRAEALGLDSVWVGDHVAYPAALAERFGREFYEPLATLALVAGATTHVTLGTAVLVLPYHHPLRLARTLTTLAVAAPGRLAVGVGAGWLAEEFAALGAPFEARGLVTDEALHVIRTVWRDERASFCGQVFRFEDVVFAPRPAPAPPLLVGGNTARARRRALELGDGWLPIWHAPTGRGFTPEGLAAEVTALRERRPALAVAALMPLAIVEGRQAPARPEPLVGSRAALVDMLGRYREAGLDHVILSPYYGLPAEALPQTLDAVHDVLAVFVRDVRPKA